jgi:hypothetical protein
MAAPVAGKPQMLLRRGMHVFVFSDDERKTWMAGTSPAMTVRFTRRVYFFASA